MAATPTASGITISGTANQAEAPYTYIVRIRDSGGPLQQTVSQTFRGLVSSGSCTVTTNAAERTQVFSSAGGHGSTFFVPGASGCSWSAVSDSGWILLEPPVSGTTNGILPVSLDFAISPHAGQDERTGTITVTLAARSIPFTIHQQGEIPQLFLSCSNPSVVNAASFGNPGQTASGSWITILRTGLAETEAVAGNELTTNLGGAQVFYGTTALLLHYASPTQINALMPSDVAPGTLLPLVVTRNGLVSAAKDLAMGSFIPGAYALPLPAPGQAAALIVNSGSAIAAPRGAYPTSRPAQRGEYLEIYMTGLGEVSNAPVYGEAAPGPPALEPRSPHLR